MDQNIYDNDFEEFLRQKADQYKIYPADRVWNNIYSSLHSRRKWWAMGLFVVLMGTGLMVRDGLRTGKLPASVATNNQPAWSLNPGSLHPAALPDNSSTRSSASLSSREDPRGNNNASTAVTRDISSRFAPAIAALSAPVAENGPDKSSVSESNASEQQVPRVSPGSSESSLLIENEPLSALPASLPTGLEKRTSIDPIKAPAAQAHATIRTEQKYLLPSNTEMASALLTQKASRWGVRLFASPMVSYRRLSTTDAPTTTVSPVATGNINKYVRHQPAPGFELGATLQYKVSSSLTLYTGAQVNYSRYYIDAYRFRKEKASIAVNNASMHDTLSGYTDIRNFSGYSPEQLQNSYLQLSLPVGMEIKLIGQKKWQFSIAGDIQPSFVLSSNCYLISSDYKNYIQSADLARSFNVHSNFEAILSYQTGRLKWQFGPQYRTQLLSSYSNQYRVREYLTEYGFKFGVVKSF